MSQSRIIVLLERLQDIAARDLQRMSDEELLCEAARDGHDVKAVASTLRARVAVELARIERSFDAKNSLHSEDQSFDQTREMVATEPGCGRECLDSDIASLDLTLAALRAISDQGWSKKKAGATELEYRCFLQCRRDFPDEEMTPSRDCEIFWRCHRQEGEDYRRQITVLLGRPLETRPVRSRSARPFGRADRGRALIIATRFYSDLGLSILPSSMADADGLQKVLADPHIGNYEVTLCQDQPAQVWQQEIRKFFVKASRDERLLLYISGHAVKDSAGGLYFLAADTRLEELHTTGIHGSFIQDRSQRSIARRVLMLLDTCFSGAFVQDGEMKEEFRCFNSGTYLAGGAGRVVISASDDMQYALAVDSMRTTARPSLFTRHVIEGLRTGDADTDRDGEISTVDLYKYALAKISAESGVEQRPQRWESAGGADFAVAWSPRRAAARRSRPPSERGDKELLPRFAAAAASPATCPPRWTAPALGPQTTGALCLAFPTHAAAAWPLDELEIGTSVDGRYRLEARLGGGIGQVFKALDRMAHQRSDPDPYVAVKVLQPRWLGNQRAMEGLQREAQRAQRLDHANIVRTYYFQKDQHSGHYFLVMELLEGRDLDSLMAASRTGQAWSRIAPLVQQVCEGLTYAHSRGVIHSDIKPGSLFLTRQGVVKIMDFGRGAPITTVGGHEWLMDSRRCARAPAYASVEVYLGMQPATSDDVYSLACVTYRLLSARPPYAHAHDPGTAVPAPAALNLGLEVPPIEALTPGQNEALRRALALRREERTQTVQEFWSSMNCSAPALTAKDGVLAASGCKLLAVCSVFILYFLWLYRSTTDPVATDRVPLDPDVPGRLRPTAAPAAAAPDSVEAARPPGRTVPVSMQRLAPAPAAPYAAVSLESEGALAVSEPPVHPLSPVERGYMAKVVGIIRARWSDTPESRAELPKGRQEAVVRFELDRQGRVLQASIDRASGSRTLDTLAQRMVASANYPPFPERAWPGQRGYLFQIAIAGR